MKTRSQFTFYFVFIISLVVSTMSKAEILTSNSNILVPAPQVNAFHSIDARIVGPHGTVFNQTLNQAGQTLSWHCRSCSDGKYEIETRVAIKKGEKQTEHGTLPILIVNDVRSHRFYVESGFLYPESNTQSSNSKLNWPEKIITSLIFGLFPTAEAQDLTAASNNPSLLFDDTDSTFSGTEFELKCDGGSGSSTTAHDCDFKDLENNNTLFGINSSDDNISIGIGTSAATDALHLATPQLPAVLFDSMYTDFRVGGDEFHFDFEIINNNIGPNGVILTLDPVIPSNCLTFPPIQFGCYPGVGIWETSPEAPLHVGSHDDVTAKILVSNDTFLPGARTLFELRNPGNTKFTVNNIQAGEQWSFANPGTGFRLSRQGSGQVELEIKNNGNAVLAGTLTENSDRNSKQDISEINTHMILEKLVNLPISEWSYKDDPNSRHIGPMAQDFYQAFELGHTNKGIATLDSSGVAIAAIQALAAQNQTLLTNYQKLKVDSDSQIEVLKSELGKLKDLINQTTFSNVSIAKNYN